MRVIRMSGLTSALLVVLLVISVQAGRAEDLMLGFYAFADKASVDAVSGTPFNYLMSYGTDGKGKEANLKSYLDYAASKKVKIVFSVKDSFKESKWYPRIKWCPTDDESELVACIVKKFTGNEAVGGWYLVDEPTPLLGRFKGGKLRAHVAAIRANSAKRVFAEEIALPKAMHWDTLNEVADVLMVPVYPVPDEPLSNVYAKVDALVAVYDKPVVAVLQVFDKNTVPFFKKKGIAGRPPTYEEERVMSYLALIAGARGIFYYSVFQLKNLDDWQERLSRLSELGVELKGNFHLISSIDKTRNIYSVDADDGVYYVIKNSNGKDVIVAVNSTPLPKTMRVNGTGPDGKPFQKTFSLDKLEVKIAPVAGLN